MDYEAMLESFYTRLDLKDMKVIDVGAHVGRHAIPLARLVGSRGACYAFEPIPSVRKVLAERIVAQKLANTTVLPFALSDRTGTADFNFIPNLPEESGLKKRHAYNAVPSGFEQIRVEVRRLDDVIPAGTLIRFIKIDVEGGELDVLKGATRILDQSRPIVAFECGAASFLGYHEKPDQIFEIFSTRGYSVYSITGLPIADVEEFRKTSFAQAFWDYIAFPGPQANLHTLLGER